jgi:hypothetical protein
MRSAAATPREYLESLPPDRKRAVEKLRETLASNLPKGFSERMEDGMFANVVPHSLYPNGYHCTPEQPLPFISLASLQQELGSAPNKKCAPDVRLSPLEIRSDTRPSRCRLPALESQYRRRRARRS